MSIPITRPWLPPVEDYVELVRDIFDRRYVSNFSKYCELLESRATDVFGHSVHAVSSCDTAMTLAWRALGHSSGEVIVPSFTFASTVNAIVWNGLTPVFADIDPTTLCVEPGSIKEAMSPETVGIAAVHVFGQPVSEEVDRIAHDNEVSLLFDAAHGIGTTHDGTSLAGRGDASLFSLSGTKVVTAGEGGLGCFRDPAIAHRFRELRGYGFIGDYDVKAVGMNGKISELAAALGYLSLGMLDEMITRRSEIVSYYRRRVDGVAGIAMLPEAPPGDLRSNKDVIVLFPDAATRIAVEEALAQHDIGTKRYFLPVHQMVAYRDIEQRTSLSVTDDIWQRGLCLPIFHDLSDEHVELITEIVLDATAAERENGS